MRAATIVDKKIVVREHPDPVPGAGQILVRVRAAGLNGADMAQKRGYYPAPPGVPADIPGLEFAGQVQAAGPGADRFAVGDRVMGVVGGGAQAELLVLHEREASPVPAALDWASAGAVPEAFTTAHDAIFTQCRLTVGERLLVQAAGGGVGSAAVQLGLAAGARVVGTVRSEASRQAVAGLGALAVDAGGAAEHGPYDVVMELVGGPNLPADLDMLATGGRIVVIGIGGGRRAEIDLSALMMRRATLRASTLRARPLEQKADAARRLEAQVLPLFDTGVLSVPLHATFPLERAADAYDHFAEPGKFGKIVLVIS